MNDKSLRIPDFLDHLLEAIGRIERYTAALDFDGFAADQMAQDAVIRNLEIIGEAFRNIARIDPGFASAHPGLPIKAALGMRNTLAHGYFGVDLGLVWSTARADLPELARKVGEIRATDRPG